MGTTIYILRPLTDSAEEWVEEFVQAEPYQRICGGIAVEHGYVDTIVSAMVEAGYEQGADFEVVPS